MKNFFKFLLMGTGLLAVGCIWWFSNTPTIPLVAPETPRSYYEPLIPMTLAGVPVFASVADSTEERQLGLSRTTILPADVVKLFIFPTEDFWSFWMKEMYYSIDMIWLDGNGQVVHIEERVSPDTYPTSFVPSARAQFVIETTEGFVATHGLQIGNTVVLPVDIE